MRENRANVVVRQLVRRLRLPGALLPRRLAIVFTGPVRRHRQIRRTIHLIIRRGNYIRIVRAVQLNPQSEGAPAIVLDEVDRLADGVGIERLLF